MNAPATCAHCGGPIPPRTDPRGRKARYCCDACRAAASRARRKLRHRQELAEARAQASGAPRTPAEKLTDATQTVRALTHHLTHNPEFQLTEEHHDLARAIRDFHDMWDKRVADNNTPATSATDTNNPRHPAPGTNPATLF